MSVDTELPVIMNIPEDITRETPLGEATAEVTWPTVSASDNTGEVTLTSDYDSGHDFNIGVTTVTYRAVDESGNSATASFTVTIRGKQDTIPLV